MSCNGCRVLRRGCSEKCALRPCLEWIDTPQGQGNATLFVSKFFGRSDLMAFITAVPDTKKPGKNQSYHLISAVAAAKYTSKSYFGVKFWFDLR